MAVRPIDNTSAFSPEMLKKAAKVEGAGEEATQSINQLANAILQSDGVALEVLGNLALHQDTTVAEAALNKLKHLYGETMDMVIHSVIEKVQEIRQSAWGIRLRGGGASVDGSAVGGSASFESGASVEGGSVGGSSSFEGAGSTTRTTSPTSPSISRRSPSDILRPQREARQTSPTQTTAPSQGETTMETAPAMETESRQTSQSPATSPAPPLVKTPTGEMEVQTDAPPKPATGVMDTQTDSPPRTDAIATQTDAPPKPAIATQTNNPPATSTKATQTPIYSDSGESSQSESTQSDKSTTPPAKPKKAISKKQKQARRAAEQKRQAILGNESDEEGETKVSPSLKTKKPPKPPKDITSESSDDLGDFADDLYAGRLASQQENTGFSSGGEFSDNFVDNSKGLEYDTYDWGNAPPQPSDYYSEPEASNARPPDTRQPNVRPPSGYTSAPEFSKDSSKPSANLPSASPSPNLPSNPQTNPSDISSDEEPYIPSKVSQLLNKKSNYSLVGDIDLSSSSDEESASEATRGNAPALNQATAQASNQAPNKAIEQAAQAVIAGKSLTDFSHTEGLSPTGKRVISALSSLAQSKEGKQLIKSQMGGYLAPPKGEQALMVKLRGAVAVFVPLANNRTEMRFSWIGQTTQTIRHLPSNQLPLMLDAAISEMGNKVDLPQDASILKQVFRLGGYEVKSQTDVIAKTAQLLPRTAAVLFSNKKGETMRVERFIYGQNKQPEQVILSAEGNLRTVGVGEVKGGKFFVLMKDMSPKPLR